MIHNLIRNMILSAVTLLCLGFETNAAAIDLGFRFQDGRCLDLKGKEGMNPEYLGECGNLKGLKIYDQTLTGSFKGSVFDECILQNVTFENADFTGASFEISEITGGTFEHTLFASVRLYGTTFTDTFFTKETRFSGTDSLIARFARTTFADVTFLNNQWNSPVFTDASFKNVTFSNSTLSSLTIKNASFENVTFNQSTFRPKSTSGLSWNHASINASDFSDGLFDDIIINDSTIVESTFKSTSLSGARISNLSIHSSHFEKSVWNQVQANGLIIAKSNFTEASFTKAVLDNAVFEESDFSNSHLEGTSLGLSSFRRVNFRSVNATSLDFGFSEWSASDLTNSNFENANAQGSQLFLTLADNTLWKGANISNANFSGSSLSGARFTDLTANKVNFRRVSAEGAFFTNSVFRNSDFSKAFLNSTDFRNTSLESSDISKTSLLDANFRSAKCSSSNFDESAFKGASFNSRTEFPFNTEKALTIGMVIKKGPDESMLLGSFNEKPFFKIPVSGKMTDMNILKTCEENEALPPCNDVNDGSYSDKLCKDIGLKDMGSPMQSITRTLCPGTSPNGCPAMNNVFQYMGTKFNNGAGCGSVNGTWCADGNSYENKFAICVENP